MGDERRDLKKEMGGGIKEDGVRLSGQREGKMCEGMKCRVRGEERRRVVGKE